MLPINLDLAKVYRQNMRNWALLWRRTSGRNLHLACTALLQAVKCNRWAREAAE